MEIRKTEFIKKIIGLLLAALLLCGVGFLIVRMRSSVDYSIYAERKELLSHICTSSANVIATEVEAYQTTTAMAADSATRHMGEYKDLESYLQFMKDRPGYRNLILFFVDRNGKYYSSDGGSGKMGDTECYIASSADELTYISNLPHMSVSDSYMIFRRRLETPVATVSKNGATTLLYCGILVDLNMLEEVITSDFSGENNTFVYNTATGLMEYRNFGIKQLIPGFNIYTKLTEIDAIHGESAETLQASCINCRDTVVSFTLDGSTYYFCSAPIGSGQWSLAFILQEKYLDVLSGNATSISVLYISVIALILGLVVVLAIIFFYKNALTNRNFIKVTKINEELEKATRAKSDFLSNMSHDIRTPINGIMGMTTIAKGVPGNPAKTVECLNKIDGASQHLLSLINDVLDMSRIERGRTELSVKPINLIALGDNCVSIIRGQVGDRPLEIIPKYTLPHARVFGDDVHLRQILINILGNAVKFTPDGGLIRFYIDEAGTKGNDVMIRFTVKDSGIGISKEFLPKVFDSFTQGEAGARSTYKGTGLGMAITKQLTELMGGTITVESELHKGSTFTVTVPFPVDNTEPKAEDSVEGTGDIKGVKILLAEDNELNMDIAMDLLGEDGAGAVITPVTNGRQALEAFRDNPPGTFDCILMDIMMPEMDGIEATKAIRALERDDAAVIPILAMTANAFDTDIEATHEAGMNAHLTKPIDIEVVVKTVSKYTGRLKQQ